MFSFWGAIILSVGYTEYKEYKLDKLIAEAETIVTAQGF
jgi:hypothetical protein